MGNRKKQDRVMDTDIKELNHVGIGLKKIAEILGCHPATITQRLKEMNVKPTDTRRSFMEGVFEKLTQAQQVWFSQNLYNTGINVKDFVAQLIKEAYAAAPAIATAEPVPVPEMVPTEPATPRTPLDEMAQVLTTEVAPEYVPDSLEAVPTLPKTPSLFSA